jgi:hypothetical protein
MAEFDVDNDLNMQGTARVRNLPAPVAPGDAVTKAYADALGGGGGPVILDFNSLGAVPADQIYDFNGA